MPDTNSRRIVPTASWAAVFITVTVREESTLLHVVVAAQPGPQYMRFQHTSAPLLLFFCYASKFLFFLTLNETELCILARKWSLGLSFSL